MVQLWNNRHGKHERMEGHEILWLAKAKGSKQRKDPIRLHNPPVIEIVIIIKGQGKTSSENRCELHIQADKYRVIKESAEGRSITAALLFRS